uniref:Uncharacterized protein n=1 Tax=Aegilops tauschii subsp. strangulata TaxID=200361 RepID=A0A453N5X6_AEGTS
PAPSPTAPLSSAHLIPTTGRAPLLPLAPDRAAGLDPWPRQRERSPSDRFRSRAEEEAMLHGYLGGRGAVPQLVRLQLAGADEVIH